MLKRLPWACLLFPFLTAPACSGGDEFVGTSDLCAPMQAQAEGQCDLGHGVKINSDGGCSSVVGCQCVGDDCEILFHTYDECADTCLTGQSCNPDVGCPDNLICVDGQCSRG